MNASRFTLVLIGCALAWACGEPRDGTEQPDLASSPAMLSTSGEQDDGGDDESDDGPPNWATGGSGPDVDGDSGWFASSAADESSTGLPDADDGSSSGTSSEPVIAGAECDRLGYEGTCFHGVSVWSQDGKCRVRDCVSEGLGCGWISDDEGWGCVPVLGDGPSTVFWCETLGPEGTCLSNDVRVWVEDGACMWQHCGDTGQTCSLSAQMTHECV